MDKTFVKTLKTLLEGFLSAPSQAHLNLFSKIGIRHFSYFMMWNFMGQKQKKSDDLEILHCRQMGKQTKPNWYDTPAKVTN